MIKDALVWMAQTYNRACGPTRSIPAEPHYLVDEEGNVEQQIPETNQVIAVGFVDQVIPAVLSLRAANERVRVEISPFEVSAVVNTGDRSRYTEHRVDFHVKPAEAFILVDHLIKGRVPRVMSARDLQTMIIYKLRDFVHPEVVASYRSLNTKATTETNSAQEKDAGTFGRSVNAEVVTGGGGKLVQEFEVTLAPMVDCPDYHVTFTARTDFCFDKGEPAMRIDFVHGESAMRDYLRGMAEHRADQILASFADLEDGKALSGFCDLILSGGAF